MDYDVECVGQEEVKMDNIAPLKSYKENKNSKKRLKEHVEFAKSISGVSEELKGSVAKDHWKPKSDFGGYLGAYPRHVYMTVDEIEKMFPNEKYDGPLIVIIEKKHECSRTE